MIADAGIEFSRNELDPASGPGAAQTPAGAAAGMPAFAPEAPAGEISSKTLPILKVQLLGSFKVTTDRPVQFPTRKTGLLLAYLAVHAGVAVPRDRIKALLWSDRSEQQASGSLRRALSDLRKILGEDVARAVLDATPTAVTLLPDAADVDVVRFERLLDADAQPLRAEAADVYHGDFMCELGAPDRACEDWLRIERERLRRAAVELAESLATGAATQTALERATGLANRLLYGDPACEEAHRALIICYRKAGRANAAVKQYAACVEALQATLGVEPEERTRALLDLAPVDFSAPGAEATNLPQAACVADNCGHGPSPVPQDKPSVAVLPFVNLSGDPEQDYFADGLTEDIITALSQVRWLFVVARNSGYPQKDQPRDVKLIAAALGVRYIVEGSVRRSGARLRACGRLIDAETGAHIWAARYDRDLADTFEIQDDLTQCVVDAIAPEIRTCEDCRAKSAQAQNSD